MRNPRQSSSRSAKTRLNWVDAALAVLLFAALPHWAAAAERKDLALLGARLYSSPQATALEDSVVVLHDGKIAAVGKRGKVKVPESAQIIDCSGKVITAGFWNSHVHFIEEVWNDAAEAPAAKLEEHMQAMLTRWGFTTVFDIASFLSHTNALRARVERGEVPGPRIYTTGEPLYPRNGIPAYVGKEWDIPQAAGPEQANAMAWQRLAAGADGIKVFAGAITKAGVIPMDPTIIRSAAEVAHAAGKPVFAHPSNRLGLDDAIEGGVDVLAHTAPMAKQYTAEELARMKKQHMALIPTLTLFPYEEKKFGGTPEDEEAVLKIAVDELRSYFAAGGTILFGTDVGYMELYDTSAELESMARSGMTWRDILASLTTAPSAFFKATQKGRVEKGMAADLVVLDADPAIDVRNLAKVAYTIRSGQVIYRKP
jgi:imidazolonepropionase-like amidohydrolase